MYSLFMSILIKSATVVTQNSNREIIEDCDIIFSLAQP